MIDPDKISAHNKQAEQDHHRSFSFLGETLAVQGHDIEELLQKTAVFEVAIPSWALGAGGTRFGRFSIGGEPRNLFEKIDDVAALHQLSRSAGSISLHIPWDIPEDHRQVVEYAAEKGITFDSVNSNTFQDQKGQKHTYKYGSLSATDTGARRQAVEHNIEVVRHGAALGADTLTIWLADGTNFPGQKAFRRSLELTLQSVQEIYAAMPDNWKMLIEYKPFEPNFYSMVIPDWGTSAFLAENTGDRAHTLVDLGHHLPNTNIEQIVATLLLKKRLGGFHFNDSKYADDDLTTGAIKPYQLFLIFCELVDGIESNVQETPISWMIDASHNVKDPLEDLLQSVGAIKEAYIRALLVDRIALRKAQDANDVVLAEEILKEAFRTDVRPLLAESRKRQGGAMDPPGCYRFAEARKALIEKRGNKTTATGL